MRFHALTVGALLLGMAGCFLWGPTIPAPTDAPRPADLPPAQRHITDTTVVQAALGVAKLAGMLADSVPRPTIGGTANPRPIATPPILFQTALQHARDVEPSAFASPGDPKLVGLVYDTLGTLVWHGAVALQSDVRNLISGRLGPGSLELADRNGARPFGDVFPSAPRGFFTGAALGALIPSAPSGGSLVYVVMGPTSKP